MSIKELRQKTAADLQKELMDLRREQFNLRMARATGQAAKPDQFGKVRRNIARLKTVMGEQRRGASVIASVPVSAAAEPAPQKVSKAAAKAAPKKAAAKKTSKSK